MLCRWLHCLALCSLFTLTASVWAEQSGDQVPPKKKANKKAGRDREGKLKVGDAAPDFTLSDITGKTTVTLSKLTGKPIVLYFGSCT